jgi:predicted amidohydrolase YtcJ
MRRWALVFSLAVAVAGAAEPPRADIVFKNGNIYTVQEKQPRAEAVAVRGARIVFVGTNAEARSFEGPRTKVVDLGGATVVPGLTDAHCHLKGVGEREIELNLEGTRSLEHLLERVEQRVRQAKPGEWITGRGWIETFWKPPAFPTRWDLDRVSPRNPVYLVRADGHGAVANSAALERGSVTAKTASPFGGEILVDKRTGEPNGMLLDNAQELVTRHLPKGGPEHDERALRLGIERSLRLGWCQVQDAGSTHEEVAILRRLAREGRNKLRVYASVRGPSAQTERLLREGPNPDTVDGRVTLRAIKVSLDGALGSKGAALLAPYADREGSGFLKYKEEELVPMLEEALRRGIQVETHAIGDRANRTILDWYEKVFRKVPPAERTVREPRWRVEHAQIVDAADIPRFAALGIIPSMQPSHAISDLHFAPSRLGIERLAGAYAWKSLLQAGSIIPGGSDAPVERGEPMIEIYAAVTRKDLTGFAGEGWHPEQAVSREQALKMFTVWPAYAAFEEDERGSLEPGKRADLTVLSADIMTIPPAKILETRCLMTVVDGEIAYDGAKLKSGVE